jgi:hypothetical protein
MTGRLARSLLGSLCVVAAGAASAAEAPPEPAPAKEAVAIGGLRAKAWASSTFRPEDGVYSVKGLFDGKPETAWVSAGHDWGAGQWAAVEFEEPVAVAGFVLVPGDAKSFIDFMKSPAPGRIELEVDGKRVGTYEIRYAFKTHGEGDPDECSLAGVRANDAPRAVVFGTPVRGRVFRLIAATAVRWAQTESGFMAISEWTLLLEGNRRSERALGDDVRLALRFLRGCARAGRIERRCLARNARIDDVLEMQPLLGEYGWPPTKERILAAGAREEAKPLDNFNAVAGRSFVDAPVAIVGGSVVYLVGEKAVEAWPPEGPIREFPIVELSKPGQASRLRWQMQPARRCARLPNPSAGR